MHTFTAVESSLTPPQKKPYKKQKKKVTLLYKTENVILTLLQTANLYKGFCLRCILICRCREMKPEGSNLQRDHDVSPVQLEPPFAIQSTHMRGSNSIKQKKKKGCRRAVAWFQDFDNVINI